MIFMINESLNAQNHHENASHRGVWYMISLRLRVPLSLMSEQPKFVYMPQIMSNEKLSNSSLLNRRREAIILIDSVARRQVIKAISRMLNNVIEILIKG